MKHALFVAPFAALAEPAAVADLARTAEAGGWDALFLWDHVLRPVDEVRDVGDVWVSLTAAAAATSTLRLGPMVTPLSRRRPATLVRQTIALDRFSGGRLTMGVGLGVDSGGELTRFGEVVDARERGAILDEMCSILVAAWAGDEVVHHGEHRHVDGVTFSPGPVQTPGIPLWCAARGSALKPVRRAARHDGLFHIEASVEDLERSIAEVKAVRGSLDGFDVAVNTSPLNDPALLDVPGVTWAVADWPAVADVDELWAEAAAGPPG